MADREKITQPSLGSNELGSETNDRHPTGVSAGSDIQQQIAAKGGKKNRARQMTNDATKAVRRHPGPGNTFSEPGETDE